jgi:hypothetical protein
VRTAALVLIALSQQQPKVVFEDRFQGKLKEGWTWVREDAAGRKVEDGVLKLRALPGSFWGKAADAKNILVRGVPSSGVGLSLSAEVTVAFDPKAPSEQAGVLLRTSDDDYAKLVLQYHDGALRIVFALERDGVPELIALPDAKGTSSCLRLSWEGNKIIAETRADETKEWAILSYGGVPFRTEPVVLSAGLFAQGAPADVERWAEFRNFRVRFEE